MNRLTWQILPPIDPNKFDEVERILHYASQFIAIAAHSYLPRKEDYSHTQLFWDAESQTLHGHFLPASNPLIIAISVPNFELQLRTDDGKILVRQAIAGKQYEELIAWLRFALAGANFNPEELVDKMDYDLPNHPVAEGAPFKAPDKNILASWIASRTNANIALNKINQTFDQASSIAIWPHHFDTGIYIPLAVDDSKKEIKSIGMGWAVKDDIGNTPYYYTYGWDADGKLDFRKMPKLTHGEWHAARSGWRGAYLNYLALAKAKTAREQQEMANTFFEETKEAYLQVLNVQ